MNDCGFAEQRLRASSENLESEFHAAEDLVEIGLRVAEQAQVVVAGFGGEPLREADVYAAAGGDGGGGCGGFAEDVFEDRGGVADDGAVGGGDFELVGRAH